MRFTKYFWVIVIGMMVQACETDTTTNKKTESVSGEKTEKIETPIKGETVVVLENRGGGINPDNMKMRPNEITPEMSGYYKVLHQDGSVAKIYPYCNGIFHGTGLMFHENGALDSYAEFENGELMRSIDMTKEGMLVNFFDGQERVISEIKLQNISGEMADRLKFIRAKCAHNDEVDWDAVLNTSCFD